MPGSFELRDFAFSQQIWLYEIGKDTKPQDVRIAVSYSYSNLLIVEPAESTWAEYQASGQAGMGVFEVNVCVVNDSWGREVDYKFVKGYLLVHGGDAEQIQSHALEWLENNRDPHHTVKHYRNQRTKHCVLMHIRNEKPYLRKSK